MFPLYIVLIIVICREGTCRELHVPGHFTSVQHCNVMTLQALAEIMQDYPQYTIKEFRCESRNSEQTGASRDPGPAIGPELGSEGDQIPAELTRAPRWGNTPGRGLRPF